MEERLREHGYDGHINLIAILNERRIWPLEFRAELFLRLEVVGLTEGQSVRPPITQAELRGALGLSAAQFDPAYLNLEHEPRWE